MGGLLVLPPEQRRVSVVDGFRQHLDAAAVLPFLLDARLRAAALPATAAFAVRRAVSLGPALPSFRADVRQHVVTDAAELRPLSLRINSALMPPSVRRIARGVNTAFMAALVDGLCWLDTSIVERFVFGFQVVGDIPDSGVYRPIVPRVDELQLADRLAAFRSGAHSYNTRLFRRLRARRWASATERARDVGVATKTVKERSKGLIVGPYDSVSALHDAVAALYPSLPRAAVLPRPMPRFGVEQKDDIRAIDDGKANGANYATRMVETVATPSFVYPAIVARAVHVAAAAAQHGAAAAAAQHGAATAAAPPVLMPPMVLALADLSAAYRTIPSAQPWLTSFAFYDPAAGRPQYYWLPGHNFGLTSAVLNFNRHPELIVVAARALAAVPADHYYDDFLLPDLAVGGRSALDFLEALVLALGTGAPRPPGTVYTAPELDPGKTLEPAASNTLLGVVADLGSASTLGQVSFHVHPNRTALVLDSFERAFERGLLTPHEAARLRGKTFFSLSAGMAMVGRAATLPLVQRQYHDATYEFVAGSELHHSLLFFRALLPRLPRLRIALAPDPRPPLLVYTDAAFWLDKKRARGGECLDRRSRLRGGLGAVVYDPETRRAWYAYADPPWDVLLSSWRTDKKTYIAELETLAAVAVYTTYPAVFAGRKINHMIDNTVALAALVHGYAGKPELAKAVNVFYLQMIGLGAAVYFDWVPSKANIADLPSRAAWAHLRAELRGLRAAPLPDALVIPDVDTWRAPLDTWFTRFSHLRRGPPL